MAGSIGDVLTIARMTELSRYLAHGVAGGLEKISIAPKGTEKTADSLGYTGDRLVACGKERVVTPM